MSEMKKQILAALFLFATSLSAQVKPDFLSANIDPSKIGRAHV